MCGKKESERNPTSFFSLVVLTPETRSAANSILRRIMVDLCVVMVGRLKRGEVTPFEVSPASRRRVAALSNGHDGPTDIGNSVLPGFSDSEMANSWTGNARFMILFNKFQNS